MAQLGMSLGSWLLSEFASNENPKEDWQYGKHQKNKVKSYTFN